MFARIKKQFFAGLIIFVPVSLTFYFSYLLFLLISGMLTPVLALQRWVYIQPGAVRPISFVVTLLLIWGLGVLMSNYFGRRLVVWVESFFLQIPVFRGFYEAIQKIAEAFFGTQKAFRAAVLVEYPRLGTYTVGFITSEMPGSIFNGKEPYVCVFIPTVPNPTSGILLYVAKSETIHLDLSMEEVAKIYVSHGFVPVPESAVKKG